MHESKNESINNDDITEATLILARYILETGDVDGVMEFLQSMVQEDKVVKYFLDQVKYFLSSSVE